MKKFKSFYRNGWKLPMNIQLFAEGSAAEGGSEGDGAGSEENNGGSDDGSKGDNKKPTYEELAAQLAAANANMERLKAASNKATKQAADYKRRLHEKMTPEEIEAEKDTSAKSATEERLRELEAELGRIKSVERHMTAFKMNKETAEKFAQLEADGKAEEYATAMSKHIEAIEKAAFQKTLSNRPESHAGHDDGKGETQAEKIAKGLKARSIGVDENILKNYI